MKAERFTISPYIARKKNWPATFVGTVLKSTPKALYVYGRGTTERHIVCWHCGRTLTHPVSRVLGIGPECGKHYWNVPLTEENIEWLKRQIEDIRFEGWMPISMIRAREPSDEAIDIPEKITKKFSQPVLDAPQEKFCELKDGKLHVTFPFDPVTVANVKRLSGRRWNPTGPGRGFWTATLSLESMEILRDADFRFDEEVLDWERRLTQPPDDDIYDLVEDIPGLGGELMPFQKDGVAWIESRKGRALVGDDMGLGKTMQALAWLQLHPEARPVLIVCPSSVKLKWAREARKWMDRPRVRVLSGKKPGNKRPSSDINIINYDVLGGWMDTLKAAKLMTIILDEAHYIKTNKAQRTRNIKHLSRGVPHFIALSGTPFLNRPVEIYNAVNLIEPGLFPNYMRFCERYCEGHHDGYGWNMRGASNTAELHKILTESVMIRRMKRDVLKDLPPKRRIVVPLDIENAVTYRKAEQDFLGFLKSIDLKKYERAKRAEALVKINTLKRLAFAGKVNGLADWIDNYLDTDKKLVLFCHHKEAVSYFMDRYGEIAVKIDGGTAPSNRQNIVDRFQKDPEIKLFVGTKAAKEGIDLTAADSTVFTELWWTPGDHDQAEDRVNRIGQESDSISAYYLLAAGTIEEDIAYLLDAKRDVFSRVLDGKAPGQGAMLSMLLSMFKEREGI